MHLYFFLSRYKLQYVPTMRNLVLLTFVCACVAATLAMPASRPPPSERDGRILAFVFQETLAEQMHNGGGEGAAEGTTEGAPHVPDNPDHCFFIFCITDVDP